MDCTGKCFFNKKINHAMWINFLSVHLHTTQGIVHVFIGSNRVMFIIMEWTVQVMFI